MGDKRLIPPGLTYLANNIITKDNLLGTDKVSGARWAKDLNLSKEGETIFFAGCGYQYGTELELMMSLIRRIDKSAISTELTMSLAAFQKKLGIDASGIYRRVLARGGNPDAQPLKDAVKVLKRCTEFGYLAEEEPCCGGLLYYSGQHQEFAQHAQRTYNRLKSKGVKRIISIIPACTYTLRHLIPNTISQPDLEVKHFCEIVAANISSWELHFPREVKVTYHDPCQLVRYLRLVEEPRQILRSIKGVQLIEPKWAKGEWATCCGGGGGFEAVFPELSLILAVNRVKELLDTGAEIIVTHCPGCLLQLKAGLRELKVTNVKALDLTQIIALALEGDK